MTRTVFCVGFVLCSAFCFTLSVAKMNCDSIATPRYGIKECTNGDMQGSVCTLKCNQYFDLDETTESEIKSVCQEDSTWSVSSFGCTAIKCEPAHTSPKNGDVICTAENFMDSMCVFQCEELYDMVGLKDLVIYSMCKDDGDGDAFARWYTPFDTPTPPVCKPMACYPNFTNPENGQVICSAHNYAGSFCVVNCNEGYDLVGTDDSFITTTCRDDRNGDAEGAWDIPEPQMCKLPDGTCDTPSLKSKDVIFDECESSKYVPGTRCPMKCKQSTHYLLGASHIECGNSLKWVVKGMPRCVECNGVKHLQILSLIHTSNTRQKFQLAAKIVTRMITYLQRKKFKVDLQVKRFNSEVDTESQFATSPLDPKEHKKILEALPFSGTGEDTAEALAHAYDVFEDTMKNDELKVVLLVTDEMKGTEEAAREARNLRDEGVTIVIFKLEKDIATMEYLEKITGRKTLIFETTSPKEVERQKSTFYDEIYVKTLEKGCQVNH